MSTAALALLTAATALVATVVVASVVMGARRASDRRVTRCLVEMERQMSALANELAHTVESIREDAYRARIVESLGQALDLDEVLQRCAEAAASLPGVAGATVDVVLDGVPHTASAGHGTPDLGAGSTRPVAVPEDSGRVRAIGISYHYAGGGEEPASISSAVAVPLESVDGHLGFLTVFGGDEEPPVAGREFRALEAIAAHTGPAVDTAQARIRQRQVPETDALTGLGSRQRFHETLALEVARALRQGRTLAVCLLDLDDFKPINLRIGQLAGDTLLVDLAEMIREIAPEPDRAYRIGGDEFAVILTDSGRIDAEATFARVQATLRRRPPPDGPSLSLSAGIAELKQDDDGVSLFDRAERALHRAKTAGKGTAA